MPDLKEKYRWVETRFKEAFPSSQVLMETRDYGLACVLTLIHPPLPVTSKTRRWLFVLEGEEANWYEDNSRWQRIGLATASDPQAEVEQHIAALQQVIGK